MRFRLINFSIASLVLTSSLQIRSPKKDDTRISFSSSERLENNLISLSDSEDVMETWRNLVKASFMPLQSKIQAPVESSVKIILPRAERGNQLGKNIGVLASISAANSGGIK